jgi:hypothetical protein
MSNYNSAVRNESGFKTFPVAANTTQAIFTRVKLGSDGTVSVAGLNEKGIGAVDSIQGGPTPCIVVKLQNAPGEQYGVAAANTTINVADAIYAAASGTVSTTSANTVQVGVATSAVTSTAAGVVLTYLPV